jgi:stage II sporulation protein B
VIPLSHEEFHVVEEKSPTNQDTVPFFDTPILNEYTTDFGEYRSPFAEEADRVERIIRESQQDYNGDTGYYREPEPERVERTAAHESASPQREPWFEPQLGAKVRRSSNPPWLRIIASVSGAVVTGVAFGFFVLSMFTDRNASNHVAAPGTTAVQTAPANGGKDAQQQGNAAAGADKAAAGQTPAADKPAVSAAGAGSLITVNLPGKTYSFLQNGVFSTQQSAEAAQAELKKKGFAAAADLGEKTVVYAGFALTREDAVTLSRQFRSSKLDVYVKPVEVPAVSKLKWSGSAKSDAVGSYFTQGDKLVQMIAGFTLLHLEETKPTALEDASAASVKSAQQAWIAAGTSVKEGAGEDAKQGMQKMATAMNAAVASMDEYKKNPSAAYLWQAQGALMQYILAEKTLLTQLSAQ